MIVPHDMRGAGRLAGWASRSRTRGGLSGEDIILFQRAANTTNHFGQLTEPH